MTQRLCEHYRNLLPADVLPPEQKADAVQFVEDSVVPDIDLDDDGEPDSISLALHLETIPAELSGPFDEPLSDE